METTYRHSQIRMTRDRIATVASLLCFLVTFSFGLLCYHYPGIQQDEAYFAMPLFLKHSALFSTSHSIPVMLMSYLGCLKTWLYAPLLHLFEPSVALIRLPVLLLAAITVVLIMRLAYLIRGRAAAIVTGTLLATDASYLLTSVFDWGPVVLQHFLSVLSATLVIRFFQTRRDSLLALAALCAGLALWDKALFIWMLSASGVAALAVYPREIWHAFSGRRIAILGLAFLLGAAPLVYFNFKTGLGTFRDNRRDLSEVAQKTVILKRTFDGSALFGYLVNDAGTGPERSPSNRAERVSITVSRAFGTHRENIFGWLCLAAVAWSAVVLRGPSLKVGIFLVLACAIAWFEMASTVNAGGSAHHVILIWPLPHLFIGLVATETLFRFPRALIPIAAVLGVAVVANLLNVNQYVSQFARFGSPVPWTDAVTALAKTASGLDGTVAVYDWGLSNPVVLLNKGRVKVVDEREALNGMLGNPQAYSQIRPLIDSRVVWAAWSEGHDVITASNEMVDQVMARAGLRRCPITVIRDRNGREMIDLFRYESEGSNSPAGVSQHAQR